MGSTRGWLAAAAGVMLLAATLAGWAAEQPPRLDLNAASAQELETLPQVGPVLAQRIVEFRQKHGPFRSVDDLLKVQGVGEKVLARLRDRLTVTGQKP